MGSGSSSRSGSSGGDNIVRKGGRRDRGAHGGSDCVGKARRDWNEPAKGWGGKQVQSIQDYERPSQNGVLGHPYHHGVVATCTDGTQYLVHHVPGQGDIDYSKDKNNGYVVTTHAENMSQKWHPTGEVKDLGTKTMSLGKLHEETHDKRQYGLMSNNCITSQSRSHDAVDNHLDPQSS